MPVGFRALGFRRRRPPPFTVLEELIGGAFRSAQLLRLFRSAGIVGYHDVDVGTGICLRPPGGSAQPLAELRQESLNQGAERDSESAAQHSQEKGAQEKR